MAKVEGIIIFVQGNILHVELILAKDEIIFLMLKAVMHEETTMWLLECFGYVTRYATRDNEIFVTSVKGNDFSRSFNSRQWKIF